MCISALTDMPVVNSQVFSVMQTPIVNFELLPAVKTDLRSECEHIGSFPSHGLN